MYNDNKTNNNSSITPIAESGIWPSVNHPSDLVVTKLCKGVNWLTSVPTSMLQMTLSLPEYVLNDQSQSKRRDLVSEVIEYILDNFPTDNDERIKVTTLSRLFCQHPDNKVNKNFAPKDKMMCFEGVREVSVSPVNSDCDSVIVEISSSYDKDSSRLYKIQLTIEFTKGCHE